MKFGERLKQARTEKGLTQETVATELYVSRQTISSWENERSYPDINSLVQLSNYYQLSLDILLKEDNGMVEDLKRQEELAKTNKIWSLSYGMNLIFLLILLMSFFTNNANFKMGSGIRMGVISIMFLNIGLLLYVTTEKQRLSRSNKGNCNKSPKIMKGFLVIEGLLFVVGFILLSLQHSYATHLLGMATGATVATVCLLLLMRYLNKAKK